MKQKRSSTVQPISLEPYILDKIKEQKGRLTISGYIRETLFLRWEFEKVKKDRETTQNN